MKFLKAMMLICSMFVVQQNANAESVVVEGKIVKVVPAKREIYVMSEDKKYEYYFNDSTTVMEKNAPKAYSDLSEGLQVRVKADKIGKRLDPQQVEILD